MTPFEGAVLSLLLLFTLTNFDGYVRRDDLTLPRWYVLAVTALVMSSVVTATTAILTGVF
jgi:hypothetical protein